MFIFPPSAYKAKENLITKWIMALKGLKVSDCCEFTIT